jgi:hypothetical protein
LTTNILMTLRCTIIVLLFASCQTNRNKPTKIDSASLNQIDIVQQESNPEIKYDSIYKVGDFLFEGTKNLFFDFYKNNNPPKKFKSKGDTLYHDEDYTILTDYKLTGNVYKKTNFKHTFEMYKTNDLYNGKLARPNFKSDPSSIHYRTVIKNTCKTGGINFAGHYTIAEWGCGLECEMLAVVDRISGKVFYSNTYLPFDSMDGHWGAKYRKDSRMIIINSFVLDDYPGYQLQDYHQVEIYKWNGNGFVKIE